ncbi:MAG: EamA family transporter [Dysgonamonadaceae bacterium]|jgi:drug/metabolite transporter (DMT)-like permease|nr:EamA family transporter [Dysgonamonadaceae bacterium]
MKAKILIAYFLIYVVWGSTYFVIGQAIRELPPFLLGAFRFSTAGLLLFSYCLLRGEKVYKHTLIRKSLITGILLLFVDLTVIMFAQRYLSSSLVAIIASSTAIWIMAFDFPQWKINFRRPLFVAGIIIGFLGVIMLYIEQLSGTSFGKRGEIGVIILVFGCISWALGTLYAKYCSSKAEEVDDFAGSAWQMMFAGLMFWICTVCSGEIKTVELSQIAMDTWFELLYLIFFGTILGYSAYVWLLKVRPAAEVGTHAYVNPFVAVFLGTMLGGEQVTLVQIAGLIVILGSVALVGRK